MNCERIMSWISAYVDQELPAKHEGELYQHLARCPGCRDFFRVAIEMKNRIPIELATKAPEELGETMTRHLKASQWTIRPVAAVRLSMPLPAAIASAAILLIMTLLMSPSLFAPEPTAAPLKMSLEDSTVESLVQRDFETLFEKGLTE